VICASKLDLRVASPPPSEFTLTLNVRRFKWRCMNRLATTSWRLSTQSMSNPPRKVATTSRNRDTHDLTSLQPSEMERGQVCASLRVEERPRFSQRRGCSTGVTGVTDKESRSRLLDQLAIVARSSYEEVLQLWKQTRDDENLFVGA
jgi:hypothetical protein